MAGQKSKTSSLAQNEKQRSFHFFPSLPFTCTCLPPCIYYESHYRLRCGKPRDIETHTHTREEQQQWPAVSESGQDKEDICTRDQPTTRCQSPRKVSLEHGSRDGSRLTLTVTGMEKVIKSCTCVGIRDTHWTCVFSQSVFLSNSVRTFEKSFYIHFAK